MIASSKTFVVVEFVVLKIVLLEVVVGFVIGDSILNPVLRLFEGPQRDRA
jgi:hypothetical protein